MVDTLLADWQSALDLRRALERGQSPVPVPGVPFVPDVCFATVPVKVEHRVGIELAYQGRPVSGLAAAARWDTAEVGELALTPDRLAVWPQPQPHRPQPSVLSWGWQGHIGHWLELEGTVMDYGMAPGGRRKLYRFVTPRPVWFHVLLGAIAFREIVHLPPPPVHLARHLH